MRSLLGPSAPDHDRDAVRPEADGRVLELAGGVESALELRPCLPKEEQ